jgi:hypothetical protein
MSEGLFVSHSIPSSAGSGRFDRGVFWRRLSTADISPGGAAFQLVWDRDYSEENAAAFAQLIEATAIVIGHEPCDDGYANPNGVQVILDSSHDKGCYAVLPCGQKWTAAEVLARVWRITNPRR